MSAQSSGLKSLLMKACRERWTDMQWSIHVKRLLPSTGDNAHLAELLLQQAQGSNNPNGIVLLLSYLKHAISSQVVTSTAAFKAIVKYKGVSKPYFVSGLLDLLDCYMGHVSSRGTNEDSLVLSKSLLSVTKWLLDVIQSSLVKLEDDHHSMEHSMLVEKGCEVIGSLLESSSTCALLYIARLEEPEVFDTVEHSQESIRASVSQMSFIGVPLKEKVEHSLSLISKIEGLTPECKGILDVSSQPLNLSLNTFLTQEVILNPAGDIGAIVEQIKVIQAAQSISWPTLYCELMRTCLMGLIDTLTEKSQDEMAWAAFTFLKLPQVIAKIIQQSTNPNKLTELEQGLEQLLTFVPLLDLADIKCNCDCLNMILYELGQKFSLLNETQCKKLSAHRIEESQKPKQVEQPSSQPSASLILRAEPTVASILKTLDADYSKNQEALLGVLCHMLSGKSFELILAAAAATGKLQSFAVKLIKFNEFAKQMSGENSKGAQTRALLFDITFLMLSHIMQIYGTEIISSSPECSNSFFAQWALCCLPEDGNYKSLDLLSPPDANKVEVLMNQFSPGGELKTSLTKWNEVCHNAPYAIKEVLWAWELGALMPENVKVILDNVKNHMCCLSVVVSAFLCSYINTIGSPQRKKPLQMLQQLTVPGSPDPSNQFYNERSNLMVIILTKMIMKVFPPGSLRLPFTPPPVLPPQTPAQTWLVETVTQAMSKGCVNTTAIYRIEHLLSLVGAKLVCEKLVQQLLQLERPEDLHRGVSLVYSLFQLDPENLVLSLLHNTIPNLLQAPGAKGQLMANPRGRALAKLCVMSLMGLHSTRSHIKESQMPRRGRKRTRTDIELEDMDDSMDEGRPSKIRKIPNQDSPTVSSESVSLDTEVLYSREETDSVPAYDTKDPVNKALANLFRMFGILLAHSQASAKMGFVMAFIEETVKAGHETSRFILQFMPLPMISEMMKCLPGEFNTDLLMSICDLKSHVGRKIAAKVVCQHAKYERQQKSDKKLDPSFPSVALKPEPI